MSEIVLETNDLTKDYQSRRAVDGLNLRVFEGDVYGFLGPNGAGKSTTIRMLTGLVRPVSGSAKLFGYDVGTHRLQAAREVGALVEMPAFYKYLTARENLNIFSSLSSSCDRRRIDETLDIVGLLDRADDKVKTFSHGMYQRLGIAQALLPNPRLVILDEPTTGLDPQGMKDIRDLILRLSQEQKMTVFLSSHLLHEIEQICTRVGIINRGRLVAQGTVEELLRQDEELIDISVDNPRGAEKVLIGREGVTVEGVGEHGITIHAQEKGIADINKILVAAGIAVSAIVPRPTSLEDLFLKLVGEAEKC